MSYAGDFRAVVRHRDFRRLFGTRLTSQAADGAFQSALASVFFFSPERQTSASSVAGAFAVLLLPYSVVGPFAGVLLDRWRRRQILVVSNLIRTGMVLTVAALTALHVVGGVVRRIGADDVKGRARAVGADRQHARRRLDSVAPHDQRRVDPVASK